jgi:hypothetical protein
LTHATNFVPLDDEATLFQLTVGAPVFDKLVVDNMFATTPSDKITPPILFEVVEALRMLALTLRVFVFASDSVTPPAP